MNAAILEEMGIEVPQAAAFAANFRGDARRRTAAPNRGPGVGPGALPFHGARDVCWKCGSYDHTNWRTCPTTLRAGAADDQLMARLIQGQQLQQRTLEALLEAMRVQHRGNVNGAPPPVPAAAPAPATQAAMFINQPTFDPEEHRRAEARFSVEEPRGVEPRAAWGSEDELDAYDA